MGIGESRIMWSGLNFRTARGDKEGVDKKMTEDQFKAYQENVALRQQTNFRRNKVRQSPLERGWTSSNPQGKKFAKPVAPNSAINYDDFESILVEFKIVTQMTGVFGRVRHISNLMLTGNKKGIAGFALTSGPTGRGPAMFQRAINRAGLRLMHIDLYEGRTVHHDFFTRFSGTKIWVKQKPHG